MNFDINDVEKAPDRELLPKGNYLLEVEKCIWKEGDSFDAFEMTFAVVASDKHPLNNRKVFRNYLMKHDNPEAVKWSRIALADLLFACGIKGFKEPDDLGDKLTGRQFVAQLTHRKRKDNGELQADLGKYWNKEGKARDENAKPPAGLVTDGDDDEALDKPKAKKKDIDDDMPF